MPELPDVENYCRFLKRHALHKRILGAHVAAPKILEGVSSAELSRKLEGRQLESARRHGKHLLAALDDGHALAFHFGMTGRFVDFKNGEQDPKHDRLRLDFGNGEHFAFVDQRLFGRVQWVADADEFFLDKQLGPDALAMDEKEFRERLYAKHGTLKSALMDQSLVAGIGNVYSDEILYHARLHPQTPAAALDDEAVKRLFREMRNVLKTAVKDGAGAEDFERRLPNDWLLPHRSKGADCPRCGGKIAALKMQGRTAYFCPSCQPAPKRDEA
jgi:formamidopyrimidine-DNA glycosylase